MKRTIFLIVFFLSLFPALKAQKITISGYVKDTTSGEVLIGASVYNAKLIAGTTTNTYGYYSLTIPEQDSVTLIYSFIGYNNQTKILFGNKNHKLDILLASSDYNLNEVVVSAERNDENVQKAQMGIIKIPTKQITELPAIGGETDVLKVIQLLPGVQAGKEGTSNFYVRGGNADQNLILLDEATIYNPNHLYGLFSTFNSNALNNISLIKGGFPAEYGGRLSSILKITMKEGNKNKFSGYGGIGLLTSNLTLEGPINKGKGSYIASGRRSYADLIMKAVYKKSTLDYYFYDVNAKINYSLNQNNRIYLSLFSGLDNAAYTAASSLNYGIDFGNKTATLRWNHLFGTKIFSNTSLVYNDYHNDLTTTQDKYYSQLYSGIRDLTGKTDFQAFPNTSHNIKFGASYSYRTFIPSAISSKIPVTGKITTIKPDSITEKYSNQIALYAGDEFKINKKISYYLGARIPVFFDKNIQYQDIEPRTSLKYSLSASSSVKASYTKMNQFLHLVQSNTASLPTDIWISSSKIVKPQISQQVSLGWFKNFKNNTIETSVEAYYKTMQNQVLFKEGTQLQTYKEIDQQLTFGEGLSYGIEFFAKKSFGKLTGWTSYTLSRTTQQFDSLNRGDPFPFAYDNRHNISIVAVYELNKKWVFSADWVFTSGGSYTLPLGRVTVAQDGSLYGGTYSDYTTRNNYRYRPYHRLDINIIYRSNMRKVFHHPVQYFWKLGIYNVYSRLNPYYVYLTTDPVTGLPLAKEVSLLPIIPSLNWSFKF
ncbi:MAG: TonB-dependent receptor [Bacteroidota bacterium]